MPGLSPALYCYSNRRAPPWGGRLTLLYANSAELVAWATAFEPRGFEPRKHERTKDTKRKGRRARRGRGAVSGISDAADMPSRADKGVRMEFQRKDAKGAKAQSGSGCGMGSGGAGGGGAGTGGGAGVVEEVDEGEAGEGGDSHIAECRAEYVQRVSKAG